MAVDYRVGHSPVKTFIPGRQVGVRKASSLGRVPPKRLLNLRGNVYDLGRLIQQLPPVTELVRPEVRFEWELPKPLGAAHLPQSYDYADQTYIRRNGQVIHRIPNSVTTRFVDRSPILGVNFYEIYHVAPGVNNATVDGAGVDLVFDLTPPDPGPDPGPTPTPPTPPPDPTEPIPPADLCANPPPVDLRGVVNEDGTYILSCNLFTGTGVVTYQWLRGGQTIGVSTEPEFSGGSDRVGIDPVEFSVNITRSGCGDSFSGNVVLSSEGEEFAITSFTGEVTGEGEVTLEWDVIGTPSSFILGRLTLPGTTRSHVFTDLRPTTHTFELFMLAIVDGEERVVANTTVMITISFGTRCEITIFSRNIAFVGLETLNIPSTGGGPYPTVNWLINGISVGMSTLLSIITSNTNRNLVRDNFLITEQIPGVYIVRGVNSEGFDCIGSPVVIELTDNDGPPRVESLRIRAFISEIEDNPSDLSIHIFAWSRDFTITHLSVELRIGPVVYSRTANFSSPIDRNAAAAASTRFVVAREDVMGFTVEYRSQSINPKGISEWTDWRTDIYEDYE